VGRFTRLVADRRAVGICLTLYSNICAAAVASGHESFDQPGWPSSLWCWLHVMPEGFSVNPKLCLNCYDIPGKGRP
jgi:hypothetical protein